MEEIAKQAAASKEFEHASAPPPPISAPLSVTSDMRVASHSSLEKLKQFRKSLEYSASTGFSSNPPSDSMNHRSSFNKKVSWPFQDLIAAPDEEPLTSFQQPPPRQKSSHAPRPKPTSNNNMEQNIDMPSQQTRKLAHKDQYEKQREKIARNSDKPRVPSPPSPHNPAFRQQETPLPITHVDNDLHRSRSRSSRNGVIPPESSGKPTYEGGRNKSNTPYQRHSDITHDNAHPLQQLVDRVKDFNSASANQDIRTAESARGGNPLVEDASSDQDSASAEEIDQEYEDAEAEEGTSIASGKSENEDSFHSEADAVEDSEREEEETFDRDNLGEHLGVEEVKEREIGPASVDNEKSLDETMEIIEKTFENRCTPESLPTVLNPVTHTDTQPENIQISDYKLSSQSNGTHRSNERNADPIFPLSPDHSFQRSRQHQQNRGHHSRRRFNENASDEDADEVNLSGSWKDFSPKSSRNMPEIHIHNHNHFAPLSPTGHPQKVDTVDKEQSHYQQNFRGYDSIHDTDYMNVTSDGFLREKVPRHQTSKNAVLMASTSEALRESIDLSGLSLQVS